MTNPYFTKTGSPGPNAAGSSTSIRNEFSSIQTAFDKLPTLAANAGKLVVVNAGATALEATSAAASLVLTGSTINSTTIGATTPSTGAFTTVSATVGITGNLTGNVGGNLAGNVTSAGTSTFVNVSISGTLDMDAGTASTITGLATPSNSTDAATKGYVDTADNLRLLLAGGTMSGAIAMGTNKITGLGTPTLAADAATKTYVDTSISNLVASAPGLLDTLDELAAALGDDPNFATTVTNSIAAKLPLAGGTMSGPIAMGTQKITGLGTPTLAADAATKTYVDTADALRLPLAGGTMSGVLNMGAQKITNLATPTVASDAVRLDYVTTLYGSTASAEASATTATTQAGIATTQASNALTSANNAAASYDSFDDRYLGSKAADPTLDNDGAALLTGALYWNSVAGEMRVYNGAAWVAAYLPAAGYATLAGTETLTNKTIAYASNTLTGVQPGLVSGTNIKTINGATLLGAGDMTVGGGSLTISNKTAAYTVVAGDNGTIINCTSGTFTVSLTAAATLGAGFNCWIVNSGTGTITVDPNASEMVDGYNVGTAFALVKNQGYMLVCNGTGWHTLATKTFGGTIYSTQLGMSALATGISSIAIGDYASTSTASGAIALGSSVSASANYSVAIGRNSGATASVAITGAGAMALGGSYASGTDSFAAAIANNTSTYGAQGANSVAIGQFAKATNAGGIAFSHTQLAGVGAVSSSTGAVAFGDGVTASGGGAWAAGQYANAAQYGKWTWASGRLSATGDAQFGLLVLRASTTGSSVVLCANGSGTASITNQLIVATGQVMAFTGTIIGKQTASANIAAYEIIGTIVNNAGTVTMPTGTVTAIGTPAAGWTAPTLAADNTNKGLTVNSGFNAATNISWVCEIKTSELTYA